MKINITKDWLQKWMDRVDDSNALAGPRDFEELDREVDARTVTPAVISRAPSQLGKVVRFIREKKGMNTFDLASIADIDEADLLRIETNPKEIPSPRTLIHLADALGLSRDGMKTLVGFTTIKETPSIEGQLKFAAQSNRVDAVPSNEYEAIRVLVEVLSEKKAEV